MPPQTYYVYGENRVPEKKLSAKMKSPENQRVLPFV